MQCPDCNGDGTTVVSHIRHADGTGIRNVRLPCSRCDGSGVVDDRTPEWIALGERMRAARVHGWPYRTQSEEARRRGMDAATVGRMERGAIEPVPGGDFAEREASAKETQP